MVCYRRSSVVCVRPWLVGKRVRVSFRCRPRFVMMDIRVPQGHTIIGSRFLGVHPFQRINNRLLSISLPVYFLTVTTMAKPRRRSRQPAAKEDEKLNDSSDDPAVEIESEAEEPKPVSSESENEDDDVSDDNETFRHPLGNPEFRSSAKTASNGSRLYAPYRSLGIVASGRPFHVLSHETATMICVPIHDRFQILSERLQPIMVSQQVASGTISHLVADATLSVTVVAHGSSKVTLFHRTRALDSRSVRNKHARGMSITSMLHLGRTQRIMTGEKEGKKENVAFVAVVLGRLERQQLENDLVVGEEESDEDDDENVSSHSQDDDANTTSGQVVILMATRQNLEIQRRIDLGCCPLAAIHPPTYLNKIVLGGHRTESDGTKHLCMSLVNVRSGKIVHRFKCLPDNKDGWITTLQPSPAVDTVAVGTNDGYVHLVNLRHDKLLFSLHHKSLDGNSVAITSISFRTDASALQYGIAPMAVGRKDGSVTVWDLTPSTEDNTRQVLTELERLHVGGVGEIQYLPHEPVLVSVGTDSNAIVMHLFDSPNHTGRVLRQRRGHASPPALIRYVHPAIGGLSQHDGTDASACQILSTGGSDRSLRIFSTARTVLDKEFSQGAGLEKKAKKLGIHASELLLPPVHSMASSESNKRDWGDLVTIHKDHAFAYVWSTKNGTQSGPLLKQADWNISAMKKAPAREAHATSVCMSACGHFAIVGTRGGMIYKYNVQSGHTRGSFPRSVDEAVKNKRRKANLPGNIDRTMKVLEKSMKTSNRVSNLDKLDANEQHELSLEERRRNKLESASHAGFAVRGLAVDSVNKVLISVGADKKLILWHFTSHAPHSKSPFTLPAAATRMSHIRESDLAAIAMEDFSVVLFDCTTLAVVRRFGAQGVSARHTGPISDLGFSPDGRTLFTASLDSTIRIYDVPTNSCVDWLGFKSPPTSLTISPTGEYLATTHKEHLGISIWSDRSYYQTVHVDRSSLDEPIRMDEPVPLAEEAGENEITDSEMLLLGVDHSVDDVQLSNADAAKLPTSKSAGLVTFSGLPPAHWKNLFHMELVKERNKPREAPSKPPTAPFFLQWRAGEPVVDSIDNKETKALEKDDEEWAEAWSDDNDNSNLGSNEKEMNQRKRQTLNHSQDLVATKKAKVTVFRSQLASLLMDTASSLSTNHHRLFQHVTDHIASLGPSAIDIALGSLCHGIHDLEEGLPLLQNAAAWLIEALETGERFEAVNAYLHRFLFLHVAVIASLEKHDSNDECLSDMQSQLVFSISKLKQAHKAACEALNQKTQHTLCLLRHFSRMI